MSWQLSTSSELGSSLASSWSTIAMATSARQRTSLTYSKSTAPRSKNVRKQLSLPQLCEIMSHQTSSHIPNPQVEPLLKIDRAGVPNPTPYPARLEVEVYLVQLVSHSMSRVVSIGIKAGLSMTWHVQHDQVPALG